MKEIKIVELKDSPLDITKFRNKINIEMNNNLFTQYSEKVL